MIGLNGFDFGQRFPNLQSDGSADWRRNCVSDLSMFLENRSAELERIVKPLGSGAFAN
jgi:hypothetical protein